MSDYLNHFLGYVFKLFKKESNSKRNGSLSVPITPRRCNSVIEECDLNNEEPPVYSSSKVCLPNNLKRYKSCPEIDEEIYREAINEKQCRICSEKFIILGTTENSTNSNAKEFSENMNSDDAWRNSWNSVGFVGKVKIFQDSTLLKRFHSLELKSGDTFDDCVGEQLRKSYPETCAKADGDVLRTSDTFEDELKLLYTKDSKSGTCCKSSDLDSTDHHSSSEKQDDDLTSAMFDSKIPEYHSFQPQMVDDSVSLQLKFKEALEDIPKKRSFFTSFNQDRRFSCRSKIPVHQNNRRASEGYKILSSAQSGWRRSSRINICDWYGRHRIFQGKNKKKSAARRSHSSTTIAYRTQLDSKFDRMFRKFSKKIYQGNIIDHNSHGRWMRLAGVAEDERAIFFKNYAKLKLVLTLAEYKEFLLNLCRDHDLDYWDIVKKMTDVNIKSETNFPTSRTEERCESQQKDRD